MNSKILYEELIKTNKWLSRSIDTNDGGGSSAYYHLLKRRWAKPYFETTGYLIPTLYNCKLVLDSEEYRDRARDQVRWLISHQNADGSFPGGLFPGEAPYIFDNGQILFGLLAAIKEHKAEKTHVKSKAALVDWLLTRLSDQKMWEQLSYPGFIPAYHIRVIWALLEAGVTDRQLDFLSNAIHSIIELEGPDWIQNWSFTKNGPSSTHTIGYTVRGLIECGRIAHNKDLIQLAQRVMAQIIRIRKEIGKVPGEFLSWSHYNRKFSNVPGSLQLANCAIILYKMNPSQSEYLEFAKQEFDSQKRSTSWFQSMISTRGGLPGSRPIYGKYMPFKVLNWSAKFYADLIIHLLSLTEDHQFSVHPG